MGDWRGYMGDWVGYRGFRVNDVTTALKAIGVELGSECESELGAVLERHIDYYFLPGRVLTPSIDPDVHLVSNSEKSHPAHWVALVACGDHFRVMWESGMKEAIENEIHVDAEDETVYAFLHWAYFEELKSEKLNCRHYAELLVLSQLWQLNHLERTLKLKMLKLNDACILEFIAWSLELGSQSAAEDFTDELFTRKRTRGFVLTPMEIGNIETGVGSPRLSWNAFVALVPPTGKRPAAPSASLCAKTKQDLIRLFTEYGYDCGTDQKFDSLVDKFGAKDTKLSYADLDYFANFTIKGKENSQIRVYRPVLLAASPHLRSTIGAEQTSLDCVGDQHTLDIIEQWLYSGTLPTLALDAMQRSFCVASKMDIVDFVEKLKEMVVTHPISCEERIALLAAKQRVWCGAAQ